jgi:hypothetical protein
MGAKFVLIHGKVQLPYARINLSAFVGIGRLRGAEEIKLAKTG